VCYRAGMKVGPTERIGLLSDVVPLDAAGGADESGAGSAGAASAAGGAAPPRLAEAGAGFTRCIFFALSSVTMISPCSALALSSIDFNASDQVWPGALQEQDGLNSVRKWNAFGSEV